MVGKTEIVVGAKRDPVVHSWSNTKAVGAAKVLERSGQMVQRLGRMFHVKLLSFDSDRVELERVIDAHQDPTEEIAGLSFEATPEGALLLQVVCQGDGRQQDRVGRDGTPFGDQLPNPLINERSESAQLVLVSRTEHLVCLPCDTELHSAAIHAATIS